VPWSPDTRSSTPKPRMSLVPMFLTGIGLPAHADYPVAAPQEVPDQEASVLAIGP
jgi:hypothetical protein